MSQVAVALEHMHACCNRIENGVLVHYSLALTRISAIPAAKTFQQQPEVTINSFAHAAASRSCLTNLLTNESRLRGSGHRRTPFLTHREAPLPPLAAYR